MVAVSSLDERVAVPSLGGRTISRWSYLPLVDVSSLMNGWPYHPLVDVSSLDERVAVASIGGCIIP